MATMKAIRMQKSSDIEKPTISIETVPIPIPAVNEVLLRVTASIIAPSDMLNSAGNFPNTTYPRTLGRDFAGIVTQGPAQLQGKSVFGTSGSTFSFTVDGAHAEYCVCPADAVVVQPHTLSAVQASTLGTTWSTAILILERAGAEAGNKLLVLGGSGAVGSAVVQLAKSKGCEALIGGRGASADVDTTADPELAAAMAKTDNKGPDIVIDTVGDGNLAKSAFKVLASGGRYVFISTAHMADGAMNMDMKTIYRKEQSIVGCNSAAYSQQQMAKRLEEVAQLMRDEKLTTPGDEAYSVISLEEAVEVYHGTKSTRGKKYVVTFENP